MNICKGSYILIFQPQMTTQWLLSITSLRILSYSKIIASTKVDIKSDDTKVILITAYKSCLNSKVCNDMTLLTDDVYASSQLLDSH